MIVNIGDLMVDVFEDRRHPGGKAALYAAAQSLSGANARVIGAVGADSDGSLIVASLTRLGVDVSGILQVPVRTGWDKVDGDSWSIHRGANLEVDAKFMQRSELSGFWAEMSMLVVNQGVIGSAGDWAIVEAVSRGKFVVLALAPEAVEAPRRVDPSLYEQVDVIITNEIEALHLLAERGIEAPSDPESMALELWALCKPREAFLYCRGVKGAVAVFPAERGRPVVTSVAGATEYVEVTENYIGAGDALVGFITGVMGQAEAAGIGARTLLRSRAEELLVQGVALAAATTRWAGPLTCALENPDAYPASS